MGNKTSFYQFLVRVFVKCINKSLEKKKKKKKNLKFHTSYPDVGNWICGWQKGEYWFI
jgi:hypothetical protein